ncbi:MAG: DUF58 domain-containing protein [Candidatus Thiodiazotropha sp. (ex Myrtea sp. 'scaly one' KF741663)]|nr:DUF58 domain-containing protein [Candidatus Thiodiazotropha sp. (ex Myrtea sp. 'scaly one' KF741663)]
MSPAPRLLLALALLSLLALAAIWLPPLAGVWKLAAALLLGMGLLDLFRLRGQSTPGVERDLRTSIPVGVWSEVSLKLVNDSDTVQDLQLHDHHPGDFKAEGMPSSLVLPADRQATVRYRLLPTRRGDGLFKGVDLLLQSPLALWRQKRFIELPASVRVFPNFREIAHYALLATDNHLSQIGVRRRQRRGEGSDFHQLREYRTGDALRQIDWKASSRYRRLISKEYQDERDQQLVFMLDCGRHMRHQDADGAHLDHALNAMLLLSYVADRQGDAVGFLSFGGMSRWQPPMKGGHVVRRLLDRTYDLDSSLQAADYLAAAHKLMPLQRRRSLVVILTNSRNEESGDLLKAAALLSRRHLVVIADLREQSLDRAVDQPVHDLSSALLFQGVVDYLSTRRQSHESLRHQGALIIDSEPRQLPVKLVNAYLDVKASGRL